MDPRRIHIGTPESAALAANDLNKRTGAIQNRGSGGLDIPRISLFRKDTQAIPDNTWTGVEFDFEEFDTDELHGDNDDEMVFSAITSGVWQISMGAFWEANLDASRRMRLLINGATALPQSIARIMASGSSATGLALVQSSFIASFQEGDVISCQVAQYSGITLDITEAYFQAFKISG
jgi:hypothetical protein